MTNKTQKLPKKSKYYDRDHIITLIKNGKYLNERGDHYLTPLHLAAEHDDLCVVKQLLDAGAYVDLRATGDCTPLLWAAYNSSDASIIQTLIDHGADINDRCGNGRTSLLAAASKSDADMVKCLIDAGSDLYARDHRGRMAIHLATVGYDANYNVIKTLINAGCDVNSMVTGGGTPLHTLASSYMCDIEPNMFRFLIDNGADINAIGVDGRTPLDCVDDSNGLLRDILLSFGAKSSNEIEFPTMSFPDAFDILVNNGSISRKEWCKKGVYLIRSREEYNTHMRSLVCCNNNTFGVHVKYTSSDGRDVLLPMNISDSDIMAHDWQIYPSYNKRN